MKINSLFFAAGLVLLAACQKSTPPNAHFADEFCLTDGCDCEQGYKGNNCTDAKTPTSVTIRSIEVVEHPTFNNGESWDGYEGSPDVTFTVSHQHEIVYISDETIDNVAGDQVIKFSDLDIKLVDVMGEYRIRLNDIDPEDMGSEIMQDLYFQPFDKEDGPVAELPIKEGEAMLVLHLDYNY